MDFHFLADVRQVDGGTVGELRHIVVDSETREVRSLVAQQTGLDGHAVVVPIGTVDSADDDATYLHLTERQFRSLESFAYARNIAPPPAEVDPETWSSDIDEDVPGLPDVPDVPPVGAAAGISTIAFMPILEVTENVPEGSVVLSDTTMVQALDGQLGTLTHVHADDETRRVTAFDVQTRGVFVREVQVPADAVASLDPESLTVELTLARLLPPQE
jgi:uncharacterized protein YrrD